MKTRKKEEREMGENRNRKRREEGSRKKGWIEEEKVKRMKKWR
jgi:hypothetical protein